MKICREVRENVFALLAGEEANLDKAALVNHIKACPICQHEWQASERLWFGLDALEFAEVPDSLRQKTLTRVYREAELESKHASTILQRMGTLTFTKISMAVIAGIGLALFFIFLLAQKAEALPLSSKQLLSVGTVWAGLLITGFSWTMGKFRFRGMQLNSSAWLAMTATIVVMIGTHFCPDKTVYDWWSNSSIGIATKDTLGAVLGCCVFGALYVLPAALLVAPAFRKKIKDPLFNQAVASALIYIALLLPAIYIQCADLAPIMLFSWVAGSLLGAMSGILGGLMLARIVQARS